MAKDVKVLELKLGRQKERQASEVIDWCGRGYKKERSCATGYRDRDGWRRVVIGGNNKRMLLCKMWYIHIKYYIKIYSDIQNNKKLWKVQIIEKMHKITFKSLFWFKAKPCHYLLVHCVTFSLMVHEKL